MGRTVYRVLKSRLWDIIWLTVGIVLVTLSTIYSYTGVINLLLVTSFIGGIMGMIVVNLFANQKGKIASALGVVGACLDTFNNYRFGLLGNVFVGIYCGLLYLKGFFTLDQEIKVTKITKSNLIISAVICLVGGVILYFCSASILPDNAPLWVLALNIAVFLVQVISQYLMVEGKAVSWFGWILANIINILLQLYLVLVVGQMEALIYLAMTGMYLLNSIKATILWYGYGEE